jgi:hypothetical protein
VQQHLAHGDTGSGNGGQQRYRIVTGMRPKADIQRWPDSQHRELNALQQAQGARKLAEHELRGEGDDQHQGYGIEPERVEADGEGSGHG